jgi:transcriptional regulator with GAF, ATPase, and Fis domain
VSAINLELSDEGIDLEEIEREILVQALERHDWNQTRAAKYLKHPPEDSHLPNGRIRIGRNARSALYDLAP